MKWQDVVKYAGSGTVGLTTIVFLILNLAGMNYSMPDDIICGPECFSPVQVNSTYWEICAEHAGDRDVMFKKTVYGRRLWLNLDKVESVVTSEGGEVEVGIYVKSKKGYETLYHDEYGYLRPIKDGDCFIKRQTKSRPQGSTFYIFGNKTDAFDTVKWSFNMDSVFSEDIDIDPLWEGVGSYEHISIAGREYTPDCLTDCHLPINFTLYSNLNALKSDFTKVIAESIGKDFGIIDFGVDYLVNVTYFEDIIEYEDCVTSLKCDTKNCEDRTCDNVKGNICYYNTRCQIGSHKELRWRYVWKPLNFNVPIEAYREYIFDFWVKRKASLGESGIDIVPKIKDYSLTKMAWWSSDWVYKRPNTVFSNDELTNFPYLLNGTGYLDTKTLIADGKLDENCDALRMVNGSEDAELSFEIANATAPTYGCNNNTEIWVKNNISSGSNIQDYPYYNDTSASSGEDKTGVFGKDYNVTYHFSEGDAIIHKPQDSTPNNVDLYVGGGDPTSIPGPIGTAIDCDGNDWLRTSNNAFNRVYGATVEFWMNTTTACETTYCEAISHDDEWRMMQVGAISSGTAMVCEFNCAEGKNTYSTTDVTDGKWHHIVCVLNTTHDSIYVDGVLEDVDACTNAFMNPYLGGRWFAVCSDGYNGARVWKGQLDEVRWSGIARSAEYINQTYYQADLTKFSTLGAEETDTPPAEPANITVTLNLPADNNLNDSLTVEFGFTPLSYGDAIYNCSLYTNISSKEDNASAIVNNTINTITEVFPDDGNYTWNVKCFNSTHGIFATDNRTLNIYVPDTTFPQWKDMAENTGDPATYTYSQNYGFQVEFTDDVEMKNVTFFHNVSGEFVGYECSNSGDIYYYNITSSPATLINYTFKGYDTSENENVTDYNTFTVDKTTANLDMYLNGTHNDDETYTYPEIMNITTTGSSTDSLYYYTWINITNLCSTGSPTTSASCETPLQYGAGNYTVKTNTSSSENYTESSIIYYAVVDRGTISGTISSNVGWSVTYGNTASVSFTEDNVGDFDLVYTFYRNETEVSTPDELILGVADYKYFLQETGGENWTGSAEFATEYLTVNKATPVVTGIFGGSSTIEYETSPAYTASEMNTGDSDCTYVAMRNETQLGTGSPVNDDTILAVGYYNYTYYTTGCTNYTFASDEDFLTVTQATPTCTAYINSSESNQHIEYGNAINFTGVVNTQYDVDLIMDCNDTNISASFDTDTAKSLENSTLSSTDFEDWDYDNVTYNDTFFFEGDENYTACSDTMYFYIQDTVSPIYSDNSTNSTVAGTVVSHNLHWTDDGGLSGYILQFCNGTWDGSDCLGDFVNDTWTSMAGTENWSNVSKTINSTEGANIAWCVYANDTGNNWNGSSCVTPFSYETISSPYGDGMLVWYDGDETRVPRYKNYTDSSWSAEFKTPTFTTVARYWYRLKAYEGEKMLGVQSDDRIPKVVIWNEETATWGTVLDSGGYTVGVQYRGWDIEYEDVSGDAIFAYRKSANASIYYRIYEGGSWGSEQHITLVDDTIEWIALHSKPDTDKIMMYVVDNDGDIYTNLWNGTSWGASTYVNDGYFDAIGTYENFDGDWSTTSGNFTLVFGHTQNVSVVYWDGSSWSTPINITGGLTVSPSYTRLVNDPNSNNMMMAFLDSGNDYYYGMGYYNNEWSSITEFSDAANSGADRTFDVAFEANSGHGIVVYSEVSSTPKYRTWISNTWSDELSAEDIGANSYWIGLYSTNDKNIDKIMMVCLDNGHDVSTQEWSGSSWGSVVEHETFSSYFLYEPFAYVYDDKKPDIPDINVIIGAHQTVSIIFNNPDICDETLTRIDVQPENQTATYGIINTTNNGTAIASTFAVKFTSTPQTGYVMKIMNGTNHNFTISESYTNFTFDVGVNVMRQGWLFLNCTTPSDPLRVSLKFISYR